MACEFIIELGDMEFWQDKTQEYRYNMVKVYNEQVQDLMKVVPEFKVANAVIHFDEMSPHLHLVGLPISDSNKRGMKKQVAKSKIFTKESLARIQDEMRNCCIKSYNKVYEKTSILKQKQKGRNQDIPVSQMQNYNKVKKQYEKNKKLLEQANKKTDLVNENGNNIKEIISNLKPNLVNKKNYTISKEQVTTIKDYILNVEDTTKSMKKVNDLDVIIKEYEKDLKEHNNEIRGLNSIIRQKDEEIKDLTQNLDIAKNTISKQQKEINVLKPFKYLWNKLMKFIKNKVRYSKNETYKKVYEELKIDNILRQEDINYIDSKNIKKKNYEL